LVLKRNHSQIEIEELANSFRETWSEGQIIRSWLRRHSEELRKLVREKDWSWTNIGRALSAAGIQYKTDKGWTGENVRRAVDLATKPKQPRAEKAPTAVAAPVPPTPVAAPISVPPPAARPAGEPEFRVITRRPGSAVRPSAPGPTDTAHQPSTKGEP
jgi:hypothetical protein